MSVNSSSPYQQLLSQFHTLSGAQDTFFITFEGIEGAGKSTQIKLLETRLHTAGYQVLSLREPGGTIFGEVLRSAVLNSTIALDMLAEVYVFAAARAQLLSEKIIPFLNGSTKRIVLLDRYIDSGLLYQGLGTGGLGIKKILEIHSVPPLNNLPEITFYLKISSEKSRTRLKKRGTDLDYFEKRPASYTQSLIEGMALLCQVFPDRIKTIDGEGSETEVTQNIIRKLPPSLGGLLETK